MAAGSHASSLAWDTSSSPFQFHSSSFSNIPSYYDLSLIAPLTLSQRKRNNQTRTSLHIPPVKLRSTLTWHSTEEENVLGNSLSSSEQELALFKQKYDRLRASLSQSLQFSRHTFDKVQFKRANVQQKNTERDQRIDQLLSTSLELHEKMQELDDELAYQRRSRDNNEMRKSKLERMKTQLTKSEDQMKEIIKQNDITKFTEECDSRLLQVKNDLRKEIADRENEIKELKEKLFQKFSFQADEHLKLMRATEQAYNAENKKCNILKEYVDEYEAHVYRMSKVRPVNPHQIPSELLNDNELNLLIKQLPENYNFEIHKTIWRIKTIKAKRVAMQMPEGLFIFACTIADILRTYTNVDVVIMGDVAYGACCIDDYGARALGCDLLIHYGHSCLVPIDETPGISILYIFVDIQINTQHVIDTLKHHFTSDSKIALVSTIQFVRTLQIIKEQLKDHVTDVIMPQTKPLSPGEILGCTSPVLPESYAIVYVGDGRFHIESIMIHNPSAPAYKYDPYSKEFTREYYDIKSMHSMRQSEINKAAKGQVWGLVLGSLGRQGSPKVLESIKQRLKTNGKTFIQVIIPELSPDKLKLFKNVDVWIQTSCPRLSIDWGTGFQTPILTPYEAMVALRQIEWQNRYPMDFYSQNSLGPWTPNNLEHRPIKQARRKIDVAYENKSSSSTCDSCSASICLNST